jgi:hypothetical protein
MSDFAEQGLKTTFKRRISEICSLEGYIYKLWRYEVSHSVLTIHATKLGNPNSELILTFGFVQYLQILLSWTGDLRLAGETEYSEIARLAGFEGEKEVIEEILASQGLTLFKADSSRGVIYIFGIPQDIELYHYE